SSSSWPYASSCSSWPCSRRKSCSSLASSKQFEETRRLRFRFVRERSLSLSERFQHESGKIGRQSPHQEERLLVPAGRHFFPRLAENVFELFRVVFFGEGREFVFKKNQADRILERLRFRIRLQILFRQKIFHPS